MLPARPPKRGFHFPFTYLRALETTVTGEHLTARMAIATVYYAERYARYRALLTHPWTHTKHMEYCVLI